MEDARTQLTTRARAECVTAQTHHGRGPLRDPTIFSDVTYIMLHLILRMVYTKRGMQTTRSAHVYRCSYTIDDHGIGLMLIMCLLYQGLRLYAHHIAWLERKH